MSTITVTTYGPGGFDPKRPDRNVVDERTEDRPDEPLDPAGTLATLLAVKGTLTEDEAATVSGRTVVELRREALAWSVAATPIRRTVTS